MTKSSGSSSTVIEEVASYISRSGEAELPTEVIRKAKHHILDTLAACVSGSQLRPGEVAKRYAKKQAGVEEAQVAGSQIVTSAIDAAFANGVMAHADETDDSHPRSLTHPGCAILPAALSISDREGANGMSFLRALVAGYEIGCRMTQALGVDNLRQMSRSTHSIGGNFGAAAAAAAALRLKQDLVRYVLSYSAQQASGLTYWTRDDVHIEKAFIFGGMPARNGVTAAVLVESGFTGVWDPFSGEDNFFQAFAARPRPELLTQGLGSRYEIMFTTIKKFPVGAPIQAALEALLLLMQKNGLTSKDVQTIVARLPGPGARVVNNRAMSDINLQHILAVTLLDGNLTFQTAHSYERMKDPAVLEVKERIELVEEPDFSAAKGTRQAMVEVLTKDGARLREHVVSVRGTAENPMTTEEVEKKAKELLTPVLGADHSQRLIGKIRNLEQVTNVRELRPLLATS